MADVTLASKLLPAFLERWDPIHRRFECRTELLCIHPDAPLAPQHLLKGRELL